MQRFMTETKAHEMGKQAKIKGLHPLNDNPFNILHEGRFWSAWLDGWEGKPLTYNHHQS